MKNLVKNILAKRETIDDIIQKAAPEWPIEKISLVDRNVLRVGLYELLFADRKEVPAKVAINEAIELAKAFGGETSGRFVNGVLGAVYRELGEPGKDEKGAPKRGKVIDPSKLPLEQLGGAIVYAIKEDAVFLAFVHDIFGHWTLSKGKMEAGDKDAESATVREIKEEIGVDIAIKEKIGDNEYIASDPERGKIRKRVTYFLAETPYQELTLGPSGGLDDTRWFPLTDVATLNLYEDMVPIITKGITTLKDKYFSVES